MKECALLSVSDLPLKLSFGHYFKDLVYVLSKLAHAVLMPYLLLCRFNSFYIHLLVIGGWV
jgi:hypothetical protein